MRVDFFSRNFEKNVPVSGFKLSNDQPKIHNSRLILKER
ncbi:MAG: Uncharacterised protein [Porticoccaceae bacterium UBA1117]|nr:MAG: Uncharacterised protein [Porticoccaceae bacterium UBA1117]